MADVLCGNDRHPQGPWHYATPIPLSYDIPVRLRLWTRKKRWGCACPANAVVPGGRRG